MRFDQNPILNLKKIKNSMGHRMIEKKLPQAN